MSGFCTILEGGALGHCPTLAVSTSYVMNIELCSSAVWLGIDEPCCISLDLVRFIAPDARECCQDYGVTGPRKLIDWGNKE
jgi:hypothetical protein